MDTNGAGAYTIFHAAVTDIFIIAYKTSCTHHIFRIIFLFRLIPPPLNRGCICWRIPLSAGPREEHSRLREGRLLCG